MDLIHAVCDYLSFGASRFLWYAGLLLGSFQQMGLPIQTPYKSVTENACGAIKAAMSLRAQCRSLSSIQSKDSEPMAWWLLGICRKGRAKTLGSSNSLYLRVVVLQQTPELFAGRHVHDENGIETSRWSPSESRFYLGVAQWTW